MISETIAAETHIRRRRLRPSRGAGYATSRPESRDDHCPFIAACHFFREGQGACVWSSFDSSSASIGTGRALSPMSSLDLFTVASPSTSSRSE